MDQLQLLALMHVLNPRRLQLRETSPEWQGERGTQEAGSRDSPERGPDRLAPES